MLCCLILCCLVLCCVLLCCVVCCHVLLCCCCVVWCGVVCSRFSSVRPRFGRTPPPPPPKISLFFPCPAPCSFFSSSVGGPSVEFWWCLKRRDRQLCTHGVLGLSCEAPAFKNTTKFNEKTQREERTNFSVREGKRAKFWAFPGGRSGGRAWTPNTQTPKHPNTQTPKP